MKPSWIVSFLLVSCATLLPFAVLAEVPTLLPVQGVLSDEAGLPLDGDVDVTFTIYPSEFGGLAVWTETREGEDAVDVDDGFFTVYLGEITDLDFAALVVEDELWLALTIGDDDETDRIRLAAVPFAMEAARCGQIGEITAEDLSSAPSLSITASQMAEWDAAYSWGDHGAAGYLTAETDPVFASSPASAITSAQVTSWDDAYSWGDHAGLYAPAVHKHDDRYYTETELATSGAAQVHWDNLAGVPAGFADGTDDANVGVDWAGGDQQVQLTTSSAGQTVRTVSVTAPENGYVTVMVSGFFDFRGTGHDYGRCCITTSSYLSTDCFNYLIIEEDAGQSTTANVFSSFSQNRTVSIASGATITFNFMCDAPLSSTTYVQDSNLVAFFTPHRY